MTTHGGVRCPPAVGRKNTTSWTTGDGNQLLAEWGVDTSLTTPSVPSLDSERKRYTDYPRPRDDRPELLLDSRAGAGMDISGREDCWSTSDRTRHDPYAQLYRTITHHLEKSRRASPTPC